MTIDACLGFKECDWGPEENAKCSVEAAKWKTKAYEEGNRCGCWGNGKEKKILSAKVTLCPLIHA